MVEAILQDQKCRSERGLAEARVESRNDRNKREWVETVAAAKCASGDDAASVVESPDDAGSAVYEIQDWQ
ncbi:MAG TPA: hypothetical protein VKS79_02795 [Gemmataceae bacterium]|nr:hypothetical protein [Gemmataceae bacterium]